MSETRTATAEPDTTTRGAAGGGRIPRLALVVVTFKRQELLSTLFDSFLELTQAPWRIVIVDN